MTALHTLRGLISELRHAKPAKPAPRYLLCPGFITSRTDGDRHHISAEQLAHLYGVPLDECLVLNHGGSPGLNRRRAELQSRAARGELLALYPRHSGDYTLPKQPHRNGCHNRAPYKPQVELHDHHGGLVAAFPFRMATDCQYTRDCPGPGRCRLPWLPVAAGGHAMLTRICEPGMQKLGDPLPCHLYDAAVEWHAPLVVLRPDSGVAAPAAVQPPVRHPKPMEPGQAVVFGLCMLWLWYLSLKMMGAA